MKELLQEKGLDFKVKTLPVTVYNPESGLYVDSPKYRATIRPDNGHIYKMCTKAQKILQNSTLVDVLVKYYGYDKIKHSHFIKKDINGTVLTVLINNGNLFKDEMEMESFFTVTTSFNQSEALNFGVHDKTLISGSEMNRREYRDVFSMRHTDSMEKLLDEFSSLVTLFDGVYDEHYGFYKELMALPASLDFTYQFLKDLFVVDFSQENVKETTHLKSYRRANGARKQVNAALKEQGNSLFSLLQGVNRWTTHTIIKNESYRQTGLIFGNGYRINNEAYQYLWDAIRTD